jgi:hypothetical protein
MCLVTVTSHSSEFLTASSALANALLGAVSVVVQVGAARRWRLDWCDHCAPFESASWATALLNASTAPFTAMWGAFVSLQGVYGDVCGVGVLTMGEHHSQDARTAVLGVYPDIIPAQRHNRFLDYRAILGEILRG